MAMNTTKNKKRQNIVIKYPKFEDLNLFCFFFEKGKVNFLHFSQSKIWNFQYSKVINWSL